MGSLIRCPGIVRAAVASILSFSILVLSAGFARADEVRDNQWFTTYLRIPEAQKITRGAGVVVGVVDSGVWGGHPDLRDALLPGVDTIPTVPGDGREDFDGHGTAVAGLIAGRGHGGSSGVVGVAPESKILPARTPVNEIADTQFFTKGIKWVTANGAKVVNMSFGSTDDEDFHGSIIAAKAADIVLIASSGNIGKSSDGYPGLYPEVLTVGAIDRNGIVADFSVTGPQVDLVAPGVDIYSPYKNEGSGYIKGYGTSQSAAIVSGAAALVRAKFPNLSAAEVVHRLTATAIDKGPPGRDDQYGYGVVNIVGALTADVPPLEPSVAPTGAAGDGNVAQPPAPKGSSMSMLLWAAGGVVILLVVGLVIAIVALARRNRPRRH